MNKTLHIVRVNAKLLNKCRIYQRDFVINQKNNIAVIVLTYFDIL